MTSWLRVIGLRGALLSGLVATVCATPTAVGKPDLPFALLDSFDQAFTLVYDKAERKVAELEATKPPAPCRPDVSALLGVLESHVAMACDASSTALDVELSVAGSMSRERRHAVLGCIERHLGEARCALARATDPDECAEYEATCDRLRELRRMV